MANQMHLLSENYRKIRALSLECNKLGFLITEKVMRMQINFN
jgi:hypothetical protein